MSALAPQEGSGRVQTASLVCALAISLMVGIAGCSSRAAREETRESPTPASGNACRPLEPDEVVEPRVGTAFVLLQRSRTTDARKDSVTIVRWTVASVVGKKVTATIQASVDGYSSTPSDPVEITFGGEPYGKGEPEIVSVPAGRFRCKRYALTTGDTEVETWSAKGLPTSVHVRELMRSPKFTSSSELLRIENASVAPPAAPEPPPPSFTRVEADDEVDLAVGTCFVSAMTMAMTSSDSKTSMRATVTSVQDGKATIRWISKTGDSETETTSEIPLVSPPIDEPFEIVDVPAGRFRCKKSTSKSTNANGTTVTDMWLARGIPTCIRMTMSGPGMTMETTLLRIENARIRKPAPPQGQTYVLIVGVNEYGDAALPALRLAEADARGVSEFFGKANRSPTTAERVRVLAGKEATRVSILKAIREHLSAKTVREEDSVVLYFSGYAFGDGTDFYLLGSDAQVDALPETAISAASLGGYWDQIRARRKVLITDGGRIDKLKGLTGGFSPGGADGTAAKPWAGTLFLSSTGPGQAATESEDGGLGVFAATLLAGLGGNADADRDGRVSAEELANYAVREVSSRTKRSQTPVAKTDGAPPVFLTR